MNVFKKIKESAKTVPMPVYIAGCVIPGGLCAIAIYLAWKASREEKPNRTVKEFIEDMKKEERQKND